MSPARLLNLRVPVLLGIATGALLACISCGTARNVSTAPDTVPLIFIPGYSASSPKLGTVKQFAKNLGADPGTLNLSPSYEPLVRSLQAAGYVNGKTFFPAVYDWRLAAAPADEQKDGLLSNVTAQSITSGKYQYAIDYIGYWIDQAVQANPGVQYIDVVTHSTGGILARAYLQSPAYGGSYVDKNGIKRHLPRIRFLILGACVHFGTVHSYRPWTGDFEDVISGFIPTTEIEGRTAAAMYAYVVAGGTIGAPNYSITLKDILSQQTNGELTPDPVKFFRLYDPMRQSLMPITDFVTPSGGGVAQSVNDDPDVRSDILLDLNATSGPGNNPWARLVGIPGHPALGGVINTFAPGARQEVKASDFTTAGQVNANNYVCSATGITQLASGQGSYLPLQALLEPSPALVPVSASLFGQVGTTEQDQPLAGDGNGYFASYEGYTYGDPKITRVQWGNGPVPTRNPGVGSGPGKPCNTAPEWPLPNGLAWGAETDYPVYHDVFFYNPDVRNFVVKTLTSKSLPSDEPVIETSELSDLLNYLDGNL
jgi:hypothetical protein